MGRGASWNFKSLYQYTLVVHEMGFNVLYRTQRPLSFIPHPAF
jgi:hypothetical protein